MNDDLELARDRFYCCEHCEHGFYGAVHEEPCPAGCDDAGEPYTERDAGFGGQDITYERR